LTTEGETNRTGQCRTPVPNFLEGLAVVVLLTCAAYAQTQIPRYTADGRGVLFTRTVLLVTGIAFGYAAATVYPLDPGSATLNFLIAFGLVHVPAAIILFIKSARHAGKT
jgi:hypothetical protein